MYISVSGPCPTDDIHGLYLKSFCRGLDRVLENYRIILRKLEMDVLSDEHLPVTHLVSFLQEVLTRILLANFRRKRICLIYCDPCMYKDYRYTYTKLFYLVDELSVDLYCAVLGLLLILPVCYLLQYHILFPALASVLEQITSHKVSEYVYLCKAKKNKSTITFSDLKVLQI